MARESISKIAYKTLQQSKSIAGFAHKQISSRLMNFILPDSKLENFEIDSLAIFQFIYLYSNKKKINLRIFCDISQID